MGGSSPPGSAHLWAVAVAGAAETSDRRARARGDINSQNLKLFGAKWYVVSVAGTPIR